MISYLVALLAGLATLAPVAAQEPCGETVTVAAGDTLREIADRCNTTVETLLAENPQIADLNRIEVGQVITIPAQVAPTVPGSYTVQQGDWLSVIAQRFDTTVEALLAANPQIENPNLIEVGQAITIPGGAEGQGPIVVISPTMGPPGTVVTMTATGYPTATQVLVTVGEAEAEPAITETLTTTTGGLVRTPITIPASAQPDQRWIVETRVPAVDDIRPISTVFTVTNAQEAPAQAELAVSTVLSDVESSTILSQTQAIQISLDLLQQQGLEAQTPYDYAVYTQVEFPNGDAGALVGLGFANSAQGYQFLYQIQEGTVELVEQIQDSWVWGVHSLQEPGQVAIERIDLSPQSDQAPNEVLILTGAGQDGSDLVTNGFFQLIEVTDAGLRVLFSGAREAINTTPGGFLRQFRYQFEDLDGDGIVEIAQTGQECVLQQRAQGGGLTRTGCEPVDTIYQFNGTEYVQQEENLD